MSDWQITRSIETDASPDSRDPRAWKLTAQRTADEAPRASLRLRFDIGTDSPRHWFHLGTVLHCAPEIGITRHQRTLTLCSDLCGGLEIYDCHGSGEAVALLLRAAVLWLARDVPEAGSLFAERPGIASAVSSSHSAFFKEVISHFVREQIAFGNDGEPRWLAISGMIPRHPLYLSMLSPELEARIGNSEIDSDWDRAFAHEGMAVGRTVTVMDAAPVYEADLHRLETARRAGRRLVALVDDANASKWPLAARPVLVLDEPHDIAVIVQGWCDSEILLLAHEGPLANVATGSRLWCA